MFDSSFTRSKDYFSALQILRLVDEWVDEGVEKLRELQQGDQVVILERFETRHHCDENWNRAIRNIEMRAQQIKNRVAKKSEEIKSLRDGVRRLWTTPVLEGTAPLTASQLFNATSLREATKGPWR